MPLKLSELRDKLSAYSYLPDDQFLSLVHREIYPHVPIGDFVKGIDYDTQRAALQKETLDETPKFAAGAGHEVQQLVNTAKRLTPGSGYTRADAQEEAQLAAPLMRTGEGMAGGMAGDVALQYLGGRALKGAGAVADRMPSVLPQAVARARDAVVNAKGWRGTARDIGSQAAQGAGWGTALSPEDFGRGAAVGATAGGIASGGGKMISGALGGPARGATSADARVLQDQGINVPLWKATENRTARGLAERARALPGVGDMMKGQERAALVDYNRHFTASAAPTVPIYDEAGNVLRWARPEINGVGQEGMRQLHQAWQAHYAPLARATIPLDQQLDDEIRGIADYAHNYRSGSAASINDAVREVDDIFGRATNQQPGARSVILDAQGVPIQHPDIAGHAGVTGDDYARAIDAVQQHINDAWGSGHGGEQARLLTQLREALHDARQRNLPPDIAEIGSDDARNAYKNYDLLRRASASLGAVRRDGLITPEQATAAVKAKDPSYAKGATTRGEAWGQQDAQRAHRVLGSEIPDVGPGTAEKSFFPQALAAIGGGGLTAAALGAAKVGLPIAAGMGLATRTGQRFLQGGYPWQARVRQYEDPMIDALRKAGVSIGSNIP